MSQKFDNIMMAVCILVITLVHVALIYSIIMSPDDESTSSSVQSVIHNTTTVIGAGN